MIPFVVCADDFAIHNEASTAIAELIALGRVTATSAMTLSPLWAHHAQWVYALRAKFDMGLHLDASSDFARAQGGRGLGSLMMASQLRRLQTAVCQDWVKAQLDAFEAVWQAPPDHVDGHQHIQQFPVIRDVLLNELARRYTTIPFVRVSRPTAYRHPKAALIQAMGARPWQAMLRAAGVPHNRWLTGLYDFDPEPGRYPQVMRHCLNALPVQSVLMCHPAKGLAPGDEIGAARNQEYQYLASDAFVRDLRQADAQSVRHRDL